jgi:7,8-dihydropterin-6-yl-methyl-4-(beta-D-ribofuranosyl)aminobenzene 5'-phosphate synthase
MNTASEKPNNKEFKVREAAAVEIISLVDNSVDFHSTIDNKQVHSFRQWTREHYGQEWARTHTQLPLAEHGFSMLIRVFNEGKSNSILFDTGGSAEGIVENAKRMGINLSEVEGIVLSHGHYDHFGGLLSTLKVVNKDNLPIIVHEDMFKTRGVANPDGSIRRYPEFPTENSVKLAKYVKTKHPYLVANDTILVTGEIPRKTNFEKGYPQHRVFEGGEWQPDLWIWDDRAIVINVKQKGLVILSGCAHAGIINTTLYAQQITGVPNIYAVMGGFHLAGKECEPRISQTVARLKLLNPKLIAPSHCTGWRGICEIARKMPKAFVGSSVGNFYRF